MASSTSTLLVGAAKVMPPPLTGVACSYD